MYTIVQHSGFGYGGNTQFEKALETRHVSTQRDAEAIRRAGGIVFQTYIAADGFTEREQYPPGHAGLIPDASGEFSATIKVDGLALYLPGGAP
jgi:hypothetical protein